MPFTTEEITLAGKISIDYYLKNKPIDQVAVERPWLRKMMATKQSYRGGKENIVVQLRYRYQNNFQWYNGRNQVTYNNRDIHEQATYPWRSCHDGFSLDEDKLLQNGINVNENGRPGNNTQAERVQLANLFDEHSAALRLGFEEKYDQALLRDGSGSSDEIVGLDALVALDPTTGVVGGIDRSVAANSWWRNWFVTGLTTTADTGTILNQMEIMWRNCTRNGGMPDFIMAGSDFLDGYRNFMTKSGFANWNWDGSSPKTIDGSVADTGIKFKGIPIVWNPVFSDLDALDSPATPWEKRCYFINCRFMKLRPIEGHDMRSRKPPRPYDRYEYYWGLTTKSTLTMSRGNAHAVMAIS